MGAVKRVHIFSLFVFLGLNWYREHGMTLWMWYGTGTLCHNQTWTNLQSAFILSITKCLYGTRRQLHVVIVALRVVQYLKFSSNACLLIVISSPPKIVNGFDLHPWTYLISWKKTLLVKENNSHNSFKLVCKNYVHARFQ